MEFKELCDILFDAGQEIRNYSGRGMNGAECLGITTDDNPLDVVLEIISSAVDNELSRSVIKELCGQLQGAKTDSMGRGTIIYWPRIEWEDPDIEFEED